MKKEKHQEKKEQGWEREEASRSLKAIEKKKFTMNRGLGKDSNMIELVFLKDLLI